MQCKLFVSLELEVAHHFIERCASGCTRGFESPATFGATKTPKTLLFNPHQFPIHGRLCRCAPRLSDRIASTRPSSRAKRSPFAAACCLIAARDRYPVWASRHYVKGRAKFTCPNSGWSVGHPTNMEVFCSCARPIEGPRLR